MLLRVFDLFMLLGALFVPRMLVKILLVNSNQLDAVTCQSLLRHNLPREDHWLLLRLFHLQQIVVLLNQLVCAEGLEAEACKIVFRLIVLGLLLGLREFGCLLPSRLLLVFGRAD